MLLLDIPEEMFVDYIFPYLEYKDLLRVRKVNHALRHYVGIHLKSRLFDHEIEINDTTNPMQTFMEKQIGSQQIFINNNQDQNFYVNNASHIIQFLEVYKDKVTHLRVRKFFGFTIEGEFNFFKSLANLKHLTLDYLNVRTIRLNNSNNGDIMFEPFPTNFTQLQTLKLGTVDGTSLFTEMRYHWEFFRFCENVEYFKHGEYSITIGGFQQEGLDPDIEHFRNALSYKQQRNPNAEKIKFYEVETMRHTLESLRHMNSLLATCLTHDIKLINVDSTLLLLSNNTNLLEPGRPVMSMQNLNNTVLSYEMENLETISIVDYLSHNMFYNQIPNRLIQWPSLKKLDIAVTIDDEDNLHRTELLFNFIFHRARRETLVDLKLSFFSAHFTFPFPLVRSIVTSCPNLTKLSISSYGHLAPNRAYSNLWKGLPLLQEICLISCSNLGNAGFIGENMDDPAFLRLTHLKKLTMTEVHAMPKLTDTFFRRVLRHVKLTHFIIYNSLDMTNISTQGILSLLTGEFATTIEHFPFKWWSIRGVNYDELFDISRQFRSSFM